jgi:hypothetical protein
MNRLESSLTAVHTILVDGNGNDIVLTDAKERHASNKSRWRTSWLFLGMVRDACLCDRCIRDWVGMVGEKLEASVSKLAISG